MKKEERNEKVSSFYHETLKHDVKNIKTYVDGLSACVDFGNKAYILEEIKNLKQYLKFMEKAVKEA